jgi:hypothetical protein
VQYWSITIQRFAMKDYEISCRSLIKAAAAGAGAAAAGALGVLASGMANVKNIKNKGAGDN